jgi:lipopolysaccharide export system permease protein
MLRIKKLDIFIAKQFGLLFMGTFFICQFVLMMQFLWRYIDDLIGKGLTMDVMAQFFWYMGLMLVPQAASPVAAAAQPENNPSDDLPF